MPDAHEEAAGASVAISRIARATGIAEPGQSGLLLLTFIEIFMRGLTRFIVPLYALHFGIGAFVIGLIVAIPELLQSVLRIPAGALAGHLGEKRLIASAFVLLVSAGAVLINAGSAVHLAAAQVFIGIAVAVFVPARWTSVVAVPDRVRPRLISLNLVVLDAGTLASPLAAGFILGAFGHRSGFTVYAALGLIALLLALGLPWRPTRGSPREIPRIFASSFRDAWRSLRNQEGLGLATTCNLLLAISRGVQIAFYPIYITTIGFSPALLGVLFTTQGLAGLTARLSYAWLAGRAPMALTMLVGTIAAGTGMIVTPLLRSIPALGVALMISGFGEGLASPASTHMAATHGSASQRGLAMGAWSTGWSLGLMSGPVVFGPIAQWLGAGPGIAVANTMVLAVVLAITGGWARRRRETRVPA